MKQSLHGLGKIAIILLAIVLGIIIGRARSPQPTVHAQEITPTVSYCMAQVPRSWGDFKGASSYGLAFQDAEGKLRFVLNPPCGNTISNQEPPTAYVALEIQRK